MYNHESRYPCRCWTAVQACQCGLTGKLGFCENHSEANDAGVPEFQNFATIYDGEVMINIRILTYL